MVGDNRGLFNPNGSVTRAQVVSILYRYDQAVTALSASSDLESDPNVSESEAPADFIDVADGSWYASAVEWASRTGIVSGYPDGTFLPNKTIARQELARIIALYVGYHNEEIDETGKPSIPQASDNALSGIKGSEEVPAWAIDAMAWCAENNIITGVGIDGESHLMPKATANRASLTRIISSMADLLKG